MDLHLGEWQAAEEFKQCFHKPKLQVQLRRDKDREDCKWSDHQVHSTELTTIAYTYGDTNWKDKLTAYNGKAIIYDAIGNPLSYDGWTYTWEDGRQLKSLSNASTSLSFKYNSDGIRTEKTVNGLATRYKVFGDKVSFETTGSDKIHYSYDASGNLFSMNLNGTEYYYTRNAQGDITGLIDNAGNLVVSYTYDTWGKLVSTTGSLASTLGVKNPYRYRGYRYDIESGLYYLQSRYYNPDWGRFVNADAAGILLSEQSSLIQHNLFAFCLNNPINMDDRNGDYSAISYAFSTNLIVQILTNISVLVGSVSISPVLVAGFVITTGFIIFPKLYYIYNSKVKDSSKNEQHGDSGRALEKSEKQIEELERELSRATTRRAKDKIRQKIKNIREAAKRKKSGENHSQKEKR